MRLIIDLSETVLDSSNKALEQQIADFYDVYPVDSRRTIEFFEHGDRRFKCLHRVFELSGPLTDTSRLYSEMAENIFGTWRRGRTVMWRLRPRAEQHGQEIELYLRLGCLEEIIE